MAVLRVGPFMDSSGNFYNAYSEASPYPKPVNCALDFSSTAWPWRYQWRLDNDWTGVYDAELRSGAPSLSYTHYGKESIRYYYQSATDFDLKLTYNLSVNTTVTTGDPIFGNTVKIRLQSSSSDSSVVVDFIDNDFVASLGTASISGTETITMPKSVFPRFVLIEALLDPYIGPGQYTTMSASVSVST